MADYGAMDTSTTSLGADQFPIGETWTPNAGFSATEGGPQSTDAGGKKSAPVSVYAKDGNDLTQGAQADPVYTSGSGSIVSLLKGIFGKVAGTLTVSGAVTTSGTVTEANSAASKADLDTIVTNTNKIPASPATEGGNLATIQTNTATIGASTDTAVVGDNTGSLSAKLRGLTKIFNDVWDSVNHRIHVNVDNGNANGQSTMANSSPVVLASDQSNLPIKSARTEIAGQAAGSVTGTSTDLIPSTDTTGYSFAVLQLTGTWSMTLVAAQCNDNANFLSTQIISAQTFLTNTALLNNMTSNGLYIIPLAGRYLRVRPSAWVSNASAVGTLELYTTLPPFLIAAMGTYASLGPQTSGGAGTLFHLVSGASTNATNVKASIGQIYGWDISNTNAAWRYVKVHNTAGTPTAGSGVVKTIGVPPGGKSSYHTTIGIPFGTGIGITTVTGAADNDSTAVGASDLIIDIDVR